MDETWSPFGIHQIRLQAARSTEIGSKITMGEQRVHLCSFGKLSPIRQR
jgi:hypothetical protein